MKIINYQQLRNLWTQFWEQEKYYFVESQGIVSTDKSILFVNSGISVLKKYFLGTSATPNTYIYNIQPCLRLNDLANIGVTDRHNTFFEMLGYFSVGECDKAKAIEQAVRFLCDKKWLNLNLNHIYVTVYKKDHKAYKIWQKYLPNNRIIKNDKSENFWQIGEGPCGPNTEIFLKVHNLKNDDYDSINLLKENIENNVFIELWNIVFSEFNYRGDNNYDSLKRKSIDVGVGLERLLTVSQQKHTIFETTIFEALLQKAFVITAGSTHRRNLKSYYRCCDFARSITFMIAEGIIPGNKLHRSELKKLIRMFLLEAFKCGLPSHFLSEGIDFFINSYSENYPHLLKIKAAARKASIDYANLLVAKYSWFWKTYQQAITYQSQSVSYPHIFEDCVNRVNIFEKIKDLIYPSSRFKKYNTFGTWQPEFFNPFCEILNYLDISQFSSYQYSILMPPPNITGSLHLGHCLELFIQDAILREKNFSGFNTVWFAGFDHGGIATQIKINQYIEQAKHTDISFEDHAKDWVNKIKANILQQWTNCGVLLDNNLARYTLDTDAVKTTDQVFKMLFDEGYIYRNKILVNYDAQLKTVISDAEVGHRPEKSLLFFIEYKLCNSSKTYLIATTRPETIFADEFIALHPDDQRVKKLKNQKFINPLTGAHIPIITDSAVDPHFGTGILKVTPGHDHNDFKIGKKFSQTKFIQVIDENGKMINVGSDFVGLSYIECRKKVISQFSRTLQLKDVVEHNSQVPYNLKNNHDVMPLLSNQWFIKLKLIAKKFIDHFYKDNIFRLLFNFVPASTIIHAKELIRSTQDWCISRQIRWGHKIPVAFDKDNPMDWICTVGKHNYLSKYTNGSDVFDTWFSSCLWPLISTRYLLDKHFFSQFYPLTLLCTGYDILFIWVIRMMLLCFIVGRINNKKSQLKIPLLPFKTVLIHGLIRDSNNLKMSKSNNNGIEPVKMLDKYGIDAARLFFLLEHSQAQDIQFRPAKLEDWNEYLWKIKSVSDYLCQLKNHSDSSIKCDNTVQHFINYLVTVFRTFIIKMHAKQWKFNAARERLIDNEKYKLVLAFITKVYSGKFIEQAKYYQKQKKSWSSCTEQIKDVLVWIFSELLILLNPVCPLITEYIFQKLNQRSIHTFRNVLTPSRFHALLAYKSLNFQTNKLLQHQQADVKIIDSFENVGACINASICRHLPKIYGDLIYLASSRRALESKNIMLFKSILFAQRLLTSSFKIKIVNEWMNKTDYWSIHRLNIWSIQATRKKNINAGIYCSYQLLIAKQKIGLIQADILKSMKKSEKELVFLLNKKNKTEEHLLNITSINPRKDYLSNLLLHYKSKIQKEQKIFNALQTQFKD